jgi:hypothetical protein
MKIILGDLMQWDDDIEIDIRKVEWWRGLDRSGSGWGQVAGSCECGNEPSCFVKCGEYPDYLRIC